jgi:hypothetical protein
VGAEVMEGGDGLQIWREALNVLNKKLCYAVVEHFTVKWL